MKTKTIRTVLPLAALGLGTSVLFFTGNMRPVGAQDTVTTQNTAKTTAVSLENAFIHLSETEGPATVSITSQQDTPLTRRANPFAPPSSGEGEDLSPFFFGQPVPPTSPNGKKPAPEVKAPQNKENSNKDNKDTKEGSDLSVPRKVGSGSGMIVRSDGYILTNNHVVAPAKDGMVIVTLSDGTTYRGKVYTDSRSDLAIVKINPKKPLPTVKFADSDSLQVGQWAIAIGSPFGQENTMTTGIVSALHRKSLIQRNLYSSLIQTDASINPGNSGGPLFNIKGEVIGVNVAIYSPSGGSNGIGFAIPANTAQRIANQLIEKGKVTRGYLGIEPTDIPPFKRGILGVRDGAYLRSVTDDSPASRAGLQPGDVITRFGPKNIVDENSLREAIAETTPQSKVNLTVWRGGQNVTLTAEVILPPSLADATEPTPPPSVKPATPVVNTVQRLGFDVTALSPEIRKELALTASVEGVFVKEVYPGTVVSEASLDRGSVILAVNNQPVKTIQELKKIITSAKSDDVLSFKVLELQGVGKTAPAIIDIQVP